MKLEGEVYDFILSHWSLWFSSKIERLYYTVCTFLPGGLLISVVHISSDCFRINCLVKLSLFEILIIVP